MLNIKKNFLFKKNFNLKNNNIKLNYYFSTSSINENNNLFLYFLIKKYKNIKINYCFLLESNLKNYKISLNWDVILPITVITENFFLLKNLKNLPSKSLFLKFGPWFARSLFTYLNIFVILLNFPYFWLNSAFYHFFDITVFFLNFWLLGLLENFFKFSNNIAKIITFFPKKLKFEIVLKKFKFFTKLFFNVKTRNFWISSISYIINSRYTNMGVNLLNKEFKTF